MGSSGVPVVGNGKEGAQTMSPIAAARLTFLPVVCGPCQTELLNNGAGKGGRKGGEAGGQPTTTTWESGQR